MCELKRRALGGAVGTKIKVNLTSCTLDCGDGVPVSLMEPFTV